MNTPPLVTRILNMLAITDALELSCGEVYQLVDEFAQLQAEGQDASAYMPLVHQHLRMCGDCREEYEALLAMIMMSPAA